MRYGLVCYRDHPPQDTTYATKVFPLTPSIQTMQQNINTMAAHGGGDGPESVSCALRDVLQMDYRKEAVRICILIADAPPHGIGENSDGFPQGCPCGVDPIETARKMAENKIVIYSVACEPNLGYYRNARAFFKAISDITSGRYLSLGQAGLLPKVIVGGSAEEVDLKKFEEEVAKETESVKASLPTLSAEETEERVCVNLQSRGVTTWQLDVTHQSEIANADIFVKSPSLASAVTSLPTTTASTTAAPRGGRRSPGIRSAFADSAESSPSFSAPVSYESQSASYHKSPISRAQVTKVMNRNNNNSKSS